VGPQARGRAKELAPRNGALAYPGGLALQDSQGLSEKNVDDHQGDVIEETKCLD